MNSVIEQSASVHIVATGGSTVSGITVGNASAVARQHVRTIQRSAVYMGIALLCAGFWYEVYRLVASH